MDRHEFEYMSIYKYYFIKLITCSIDNYLLNKLNNYNYHFSKNIKIIFDNVVYNLKIAYAHHITKEYDRVKISYVPYINNIHCTNLYNYFIQKYIFDIDINYYFIDDINNHYYRTVNPLTVNSVNEVNEYTVKTLKL